MSNASPGAKARVRAFVHQHPPEVTSQQVADGCAMTRGWACQVLAALVKAGVIEWRHGGGGTFTWSER